MAVPDSVNIRNLDGLYELNKQLSGDTNSVLVLQGIGWILRNAVYYSKIQIRIKEYTDDQGVLHADITQLSTGGFESTEERCLDWQDREKEDRIFGKVKGRSKIIKAEEIQDPYLKEDLNLDGDNGEVINAWTESVGLSGDQWTADQIWGFELVEGKRRHVRRIVVKRGDQTIRIKTVYDWRDPDPEADIPPQSEADDLGPSA